VGFALPPSSQVNDVAVAGTWAFVSNYLRGLEVYDISDPAHPRYVTSAGVEGNPSWGIGLNASATLAYVSGGSSVYAFDISTPASPQFLAKSVSVGAQTYGITVRGTDVFVAAGSVGAVKFAGGNLAAIAGTFNTAGNGGSSAYGIASDANYLYVAAGTRAFVVNPGAMTLAGSATANNTWGIAVTTLGSTTYAYVADEGASLLRLFNVTNPASIVTLGTLSLPGLAPRGIAVRWPTVTVTGGYSVGATPFRVVNVGDPANPRLVFPVTLPSGAERVAIQGDYAYVADMTLGLQIVNITSPSAPVAQPSPPGLARAFGLAVDGDIAVATSLTLWGLQVYDISSPGSPQPLGPRYTAASSPYTVVVRWPYAYLAVSGNLEIVDLAPALSGDIPERVSLLPLIGTANDIALSGDYALVANSANSVDIVSIADPVNPAIVGNFVTSGFVTAVRARGEYGYAVTLSSPPTFYVFSLANPLQPQLIGSTVPALAAGSIDSMALSGSTVYLTHRNDSNSGHGLAIIDVSNPAAPVLRNTGSLGFDARTVEVTGDYALLSPSTGSAFRVFDVSDKAAPRLVGTISQQAISIRAGGNYAFATDYFGDTVWSLKLW